MEWAFLLKAQVRTQCLLAHHATCVSREGCWVQKSNNAIARQCLLGRGGTCAPSRSRRRPGLAVEGRRGSGDVSTQAPLTFRIALFYAVSRQGMMEAPLQLSGPAEAAAAAATTAAA